MMTRIRGFWAERMSLFVPRMKTKSVSLEGSVGAGGVGMATTSGITIFEFTPVNSNTVVLDAVLALASGGEG
jgi:hypothetical protein